MRLWPLLLVAACSEGDWKIDGTIHDRPAPAASAAWAEVPASTLTLPSGRGVAVFFSSDPDLCARATRGEVQPSSELLVLSLADASALVARAPAAEGVFHVADAFDPSPTLTAAAQYLPLGATCAVDDVRATNAVFGSVELLTPEPDRLRGAFELVLESKDRLVGSFDARACPAISRLVSQTHLVCR